MFVKVCGMQNQQQVELLDGHVEYIGFIFYSKSKRFVQTTSKTIHAQRVGVFVDESIETIKEIVARNSIDVIQLHGDESPEMCREIGKQIPIIKSFGLDANFDFKQLIPFEGHIDYFLFDTKTPLKGGSGVQFDWSILNRYNLSTPFILSGGIDEGSIASIKKIYHPKLIGIDINSRFEISPANKDVQRIKKFIHELRK